MLLLLLLTAAFAQDDPVTARLRQAEAILSSTRARASGPGWDILKKVVHECDSAPAPVVGCAEAWDWYGVELEKDHKPDTVRIAQPYYLEAVDLAQRLSAPDPVLALALELEAMASADLSDEAKATELSQLAVPIRQRIALSMDRNDPLPPVSLPVAGGPVRPPTVSRKLDPEYSEIARLLKLTGTVHLSITVAWDGGPRQIRLIRGLGLGLDEKAVEAVQQWRFNPGMKGDTPVNVRASIEVNFRLL